MNKQPVMRWALALLLAVALASPLAGISHKLWRGCHG
jgi:hypothetical protein